MRRLVICLCLSGAALGCGDEKNAPESDGSEARDAGERTLEPHASDETDAALDARSEPPPDAGIEPAQDASADASARSGDAATNQPVSGEDAGPGHHVDAAVSAKASVVRGDASASYWDLRVRGIGLDRFEGKQVVVRLGRLEDANERLAVGSARIANGGFELFFPQAWEAGLYKLKRAYIDADGNGRCDAGHDAVFVDSRGARIDLLELRADSAMTTRADFPPASDPAEHCAALNVSWPAPETL